MKSLKKPKINDIINYITSGSKLPESFVYFEKDLRNQVQYIFEWFWQQPKFIIYLNQFNDLYDRSINDKPLEFLQFIQKLVLDNKIKKYELKNSFFNFYGELKKVKEIENGAIKEKRQFIDFYTDLKLKNILGQKIEIKKAKKIDKANESQAKDIIKKALDVQEKKQRNINDNLFLKDLNDNIIDELQLSLFDVFLDESNNQLIYIFIDKDYKKRYYIENFSIDILVSKETSIIQNDYLKEIDNSFIKYKLLNIWDYRNLKKAIESNFENQKNQKPF